VGNNNNKGRSMHLLQLSIKKKKERKKSKCEWITICQDEEVVRFIAVQGHKTKQQNRKVSHIC